MITFDDALNQLEIYGEVVLSADRANEFYDWMNDGRDGTEGLRSEECPNGILIYIG